MDVVADCAGVRQKENMRTPSFVLLAFLLSAATMFGQSSPAAAEAKTAAAPSTTLTKEERDHAIDYLKETQKAFLASLDGVSDAQWKFKPAPDRWSIAEVAEHIAVTEETIWK